MGVERAAADLRPGAETPVPPRRVEIVVSPTWTHLTSHGSLAQYLPFGEVLGSIPGSKPSGAWARVIGLALAGFWRRHPREALDGSLLPTRRELLTRYTPLNAPPGAVLDGNDPRRAVEYWRGALALLVEKGLVTKRGEADRSAEQMCHGLPRYAWQDPWLVEHVDLVPGPLLHEAIESIAARLRPRTRSVVSAPHPEP
jgi:hypothetical protein